MLKTANYPYKGSPYRVVLPKGFHFVELWGASGGCTNAGKGGYASGYIMLKKKTELYLYVGGKGQEGNSSSQHLKGGWNGGGDSFAATLHCSGGGASDIRLTENDDFNDRIIVAGGGGGAAAGDAYGRSNDFSGGHGGGISGTNAIGESGSNKIAYGNTYANGANQTGPGNAFIKTCTYTNENGKKGVGGKSAGCSNGGGAGGGGYFGGAGGFDYTGGGGGSGYIDPAYFPKNTVLLSGKEKGREGDGLITIMIASNLCTVKQFRMSIAFSLSIFMTEK